MTFIRLLAAAACAAAFAAQAQTPPASGTDAATRRQQATAAVPLSDGEVRKVDREQGKVTLRHGPLQHLDMPAMTMVFKTSDPRLLEGLKEGDKVRFAVERVNGAFSVTAIQPVK